MEKRFFSKKQREALFLWACGRCSICNQILDKSFHADHITPHSKNGKTDVNNGQALCCACNSRKGDKMLQLREWQQNALELTTKTFQDGDKFFLAHATPGGGKTIFALKLFDQMKKAGLCRHCIVLAPSTNLVKQWTKEAKSVFGYELKNDMLYNNMPDFNEYQGICMTYQAMNEKSEHLRIFCDNNKTLVISDEMHHVADGQSWGKSFLNAFDESEHILGLTGTPWASEGKTIPYVQYDSDGYANPNFRYGKAKAIKDGVCRVVEFHKMKPKNLSFADTETGEYIGQFDTLEDAIEGNVKGAYLKTLQSTRHMLTMFTEANKDLTALRKNGRFQAGGLLIAPNIKTANAYRDELLRITGEDYPVVHSKMDKPHKTLLEFKMSNTKWLISVDMVTEGVDIKRFQTIVFLSHKNTDLVIYQSCGRAERVIDFTNLYDRTASFYYTDVEHLNKIIIRMEEENQAGLALLSEEEKESNEKKDDGAGGNSVLNEDNVSLQEIETQSNGLVARGLLYDKDIVKEAIIMKRQSAYLQDVELFVVCKFVLSQREAEKEIISEEAFSDDLTMAEKKENMRRGITERINAKLGKFLGRMPSGIDIKQAHIFVNRKVGIKSTTDNISYDQLINKFDFINQTGAETWAK